MPPASPSCLRRVERPLLAHGSACRGCSPALLSNRICDGRVIESSLTRESRTSRTRAKERQAAAGSPPLRSVPTLACAARSRAGAAAAGLLLWEAAVVSKGLWAGSAGARGGEAALAKQASVLKNFPVRVRG